MSNSYINGVNSLGVLFEAIFTLDHIVEIADEIKSNSNISFKYFDSELTDNNLKFSYKLKTGVSSERLGMYIVKKEGIFDLLKSIKKPVTDAKNL